MVKIGVISDTHLPSRFPYLPQVIIEKLQGVNLIIHAGDWEDISFYQNFRGSQKL